MTEKNDTQADAMIASLRDKLMDGLKDDIGKMVEDQMKPLLDNHTRLQDTLGDLKRDDDAMAKMAERIAELSGAPKDKPSALFATRQQVQDGPTYQKLKAKSDELGIPLIRREEGDTGSGQTVYTPEG